MKNAFVILVLAFFAGCQGELELESEHFSTPKETEQETEKEPEKKVPVLVDEDGRVVFQCEEPDVLQNLPLKKLTLAQTLFATQDLLRTFGRDDLVEEAAEKLIALIPPDTPTPLAAELKPQTGELGFRRLDQNVDQLHVNGNFEFGLWLGGALSSEAVFGSCAFDDDASNNDSCFDSFLDQAGTQIIRRPLDDDDRTFYRTTFEKYQEGANFSQEAMTAVLAAMFSGPDFFYVLELENPLDEFALANRIALHFWQSVPDAELYAAAKEGTLSSNLQVHLDRVFDDPKTNRSLESFFNEWFGALRPFLKISNVLKTIHAIRSSPMALRFQMIFKNALVELWSKPPFV